MGSTRSRYLFFAYSEKENSTICFLIVLPFQLRDGPHSAIGSLFSSPQESRKPHLWIVRIEDELRMGRGLHTAAIEKPTERKRRLEVRDLGLRIGHDLAMG